MKKCKKCDIIKDSNSFRTYRNSCKDCEREYKRIRYKENKEIIKKCSKKYYENNKDKCREKGKEYYKKYKNSEKYKLERKEYYENNKEEIKEKKRDYIKRNRDKINKRQNKYRSNRLKNDIKFKLTINIRNTIYNSLYYSGYTKESKTFEILGCSFEEFKSYLESKFEKWMNWNNHGLYNGKFNYGWDIDHIIPLSSAKTEEDVINLNHFSNLQPLCSHINRNVKRNLLNY